jgi:hypothetical protein
MGVRVALVGDRHQLSAVGRGGVLDLAARWVLPEAHVDLDVAHRFADPEYAAISLALRTGSPTYTPPGQNPVERIGGPVGERVDDVWNALRRRGQIRIYPSEADRTQALARLARLAADALTAGEQRAGGMLIMADTHERTAVLNGFIRDRLVAAGHVDDSRTVATNAGERLGVGDRVATRRNDRDLNVSNRDTWTITAVRADGSLTLKGSRATELRSIPAAYAREHVELSYATTVYGAQGETTRAGPRMLGEHTSAASAYVAMTRGRDDNIAHLVADDEADALRQWEQVFARDRADLGPAAAAQQAADDIERYGTQQPARRLEEVLGDLRAAWSQQADLHEQHQRLSRDRGDLQQAVDIRARHAPACDRLHDDETKARRSWSRPAGESTTSMRHFRSRPLTCERGSEVPGSRSCRRRSAPPTPSARAPGDSANAAASSVTLMPISPLSRSAGTSFWRTCRPTPPSWRSKCPGCTGCASKTRSVGASRSRSPPPTPTRSGSATLSAKPWRHLRVPNGRAPGSTTSSTQSSARAAGQHTSVTQADASLPSPSNSPTSSATSARPHHASGPSRTNRASARSPPADSKVSGTCGPPTAVPDRKPTPARRTSACDSSRRRHGGSNRPHRAAARLTAGGISR